jgi:hypothetical protein
MPLILIIPALFLPRVVIAFLWLLTSWFSVVPGWIIGIIGFLFFPYTLLWYGAVMHWFGGTWGPLQIIVLVIAVIADLGVTGGGSRYKRRGVIAE